MTMQINKLLPRGLMLATRLGSGKPAVCLCVLTFALLFLHCFHLSARITFTNLLSSVKSLSKTRNVHLRSYAGHLVRRFQINIWGGPKLKLENYERFSCAFQTALRTVPRHFGGWITMVVQQLWSPVESQGGQPLDGGSRRPRCQHMT